MYLDPKEDPAVLIRKDGRPCFGGVFWLVKNRGQTHRFQVVEGWSYLAVKEEISPGMCKVLNFG